MTVRRVVVERSLLEQTLAELARRGLPTERVALWLGERGESIVRVREIYVPKYEASSDYFHISRPAMASLTAHLREQKLMVGAQLHTHPAKAFHSAADDKWAIVRHVGAISVVLSDFGSNATARNFLEQAKVFALSPLNEWLEVPFRQVREHLEIAQ